MVDPTRVVALHAAVDDHARIHGEQEGVVVIVRLVFMASISLGMGNTITDIFGDPRALEDVGGGDDAPTVDAGIANHVVGVFLESGAHGGPLASKKRNE